MITIVSKLWRVDFLNAEVTKSKANLEKRFECQTSASVKMTAIAISLFLNLVCIVVVRSISCVHIPN